MPIHYSPIIRRPNTHARHMPLPVMTPRQLPPELEAIAQQVYGREPDDFHHTVTSLAAKLWNELRDIYLQTEVECGWFASPIYIHRDLRGPLEAAGLIAFQPIPDSRIEHLVRITAAGSALLGKSHPIVVQEDTVLAEIQIAPGCVPGIDYAPFYLEYEPIIVGDMAHIYIPCQNCSQTYVQRWDIRLHQRFGTAALYKWAFNPYHVRLCPACDLPAPVNGKIGSHMEAHTESQVTQPSHAPAAQLLNPAPKFDTTAFFRALDEEMATAFHAIEFTDLTPEARHHQLEIIKRYIANMQDQTGFLQWQIDQMRQAFEHQRDITDWWRRTAERNLEIADRHAANILKMADAPAPAADLVDGPRLSLVDLEMLEDLAKTHTGSVQQPGTLAGLLEALYLPEISEFRISYPVLHEAKAAIAKRIIDHSYAIRAYHIECRVGRRERFLVVNFGFGEVNVFEKDFKELFIRYPGPKDDWMIEGVEFTLDPAIEIIMTRDSRKYALIDSLFIVD